MAWPYPGDGLLTRARRVAHAYRARLHAADPQACEDLDAAMRRWGQHWAVPSIVAVDPDQWLTPSEAAEIGLVGTATLRVWRARGKLTGRKTTGPNGGIRWEYRARDVMALAAESRRRKTTEGHQ